MPAPRKTRPNQARRRWLQLAMGALIAPCAVTARAGISVGQALPPVDVVLLDDSVMPRHRRRGKVAIYLFWATWCPVCISEMAHYQALHDKYQGRGLEVLALSLDSDAGDVRAFRAGQPYTLPMAMRSNALRQVFGDIRGTPTVFLADRNGLLRLKHLGALAPDELERRVTQLLNDPADGPLHGAR